MQSSEGYQVQLNVRSATRKTTGKKVDKGTGTERAVQRAYRPKKPVGKMVFFGAISASAYYLLFSNEALVTNTYTLGGWHALFPVLTAFFFSFIHGAFASNFLSVLGLEAKKH
ncbi:hypothetical protein [Desulforhopalus singaporensis]|uniref:Uncharacterized protein n=1 Tax=Desulforhopalus singaporensis TaxID=91360 RepID=A0A1H0L7W0_9BACT|nr:hypothetical protein [Desulforhopalus singaporensis]SDO64195.1 hypothetical protein SAMN05660330_00696 [Desulforhopalus singaporensis]